MFENFLKVLSQFRKLKSKENILVTEMVINNKLKAKTK